MSEHPVISHERLQRAVGAYGTVMLHAGFIVTLDEGEQHILEDALATAIRAYLGEGLAP